MTQEHRVREGIPDILYSMGGQSSDQKTIGCLLIHGFTGTPWVFEELTAVLRRHGISTAAPLLPGHGTVPEDLVRTSWQEWLECADDAYERLARTCTDVFAAGLSAGGALALLIAARKRCSGVITLAAPVRLSDPKLALLPVAGLVVSCWKKRHYIAQPQAGYDCYPLAGVRECRKLLKTMRSELDKVSCPALIMHSEGDRRVPVKNSSRIAKNIGSADVKVVLLEHACHTITKGGDSRQVEAEIIRFIAETAGESAEHGFQASPGMSDARNTGS